MDVASRASGGARRFSERVPAWVRAPAGLVLVLLAAGLVTAGLTTDEPTKTEVMVGLALVHGLFGFAYGSWWAVAGALVWVPLGLLGSGEVPGAVALAAMAALFLSAGVAARKLVGRSERLSVLEKRIREPPPLTIGTAISVGVVLTALMWAADALTGSPLAVYLTALLVLMASGSFAPRETDPRHDQASDREPGSPWWKQFASSTAFVGAALAIALLLAELGGLLGETMRSSSSSSVRIWRLGDVQALGGAPEVALFGDGDEVAQVPELDLDTSKISLTAAICIGQLGPGKRNLRCQDGKGERPDRRETMKLRRQTLAASPRSARLAVALTLLAAFAVASPASAQSEEGADVERYSVCYPFQYGKICYRVQTVTHEQETPSGTVGVINGRTAWEMQGTGPLAHCKHYGNEQFHQHYRIVDGEFQQTGGRNADSFVISCEGERIRCSNTYTFQYANGEVRLDRVNNACQPV